MAEQDPNDIQPENQGEQPAGGADDIADALERSAEAAESLDAETRAEAPPADVSDAAANALKAAQAAIAAAKSQQQAGKGGPAPAPAPGGAAQPDVAQLAAEAVALPDFNAGAPGSSAASRDIDLLADVNLNVTIELGRTRMLVEDVLRLGEGSVVELDKLAGDPVDVFVNGRHVARGEVLVVNDNFCVRVSEILSRTPGSDD